MTHPFFDVSDFEISKDEISYTIDTLQHFYDNDPTGKYYFITGTDAVLDLATWKDPEGMLRIFKFIAVNRPGYVIDNLDEKLSELSKRYNGEIYAVNAPQLQISSTDIRNRIASDKPIKYLLPETVEQYILKNKLYKSEKDDRK
jgi:nicotinate-nucleotide adenylyltransferase